MPNLTHFRLSHRSYDPEVQAEENNRVDIEECLSSFQTRSAFKLEELSLTWLTESQITTTEICAFLHTQPSIRRLSLANCQLDLWLFFHRLAATPFQRAALPNLVELHISEHYPIRDTTDDVEIAIGKMVRSRWMPYDAGTEVTEVMEDDEDDENESKVATSKWPIAKLEGGVYLAHSQLLKSCFPILG
ncbi:hypothetical protein D9758_013858 [Tetrapyrgos nigripes]|uniref:Uncharacterized protein n=1 Tax=Tetrapyrgos nigripes TaxID=182062 RepID=A0A8H5CR03_9AGAR|nr:hypothetical protein D9758_013858 [Tetrapyrgos nigripes]